jgi:uracil-DNA glycosylase family 4
MHLGGAPDPRDELAELAAAVRAYVEWQADTGAPGLPVEAAPPTVLASLGGGAAVATRPVTPTFASPAWGAPAPQSPVRMEAAALKPIDPSTPARPAPALKPALDRETRSVEPAPLEPPASNAADERRTRLALLAEEVRSCTKCVLHEKRRRTVFSRGDPFAELMFVGEGPGADEDAQGEPFVGAAGQLLDRMIAAMGYGRNDVYIANIVKCRPPNNRKPEPDEMASCMPYLVQQLGLVRPKVIVALGGTAMQGLCGTSEGITRLRGKWKLYKGSIPIMPTFHPAYLLRNPAGKRDVWSDLQDVMNHLGKAPPGKG